MPSMKALPTLCVGALIGAASLSLAGMVVGGAQDAAQESPGWRKDRGWGWIWGKC